ncbi:muscarinic acetylcholine receptor M2-like [Mercenaria mercenaria]|uniref:muscarinic acetylcholine receptor M2-like n=1 Tax=Mercenaria mercenaria TaxID=6596 RepID=UPI001E1E1179|nr:muscarinic acetylcholine receptor M2-like [Mercenaria mercenaria]XP_045186979.1 muscarinic acetylcholine receptor M2-like [Mercenaria mercenaria]XP_045186980.1 muscarinic acetylcholine receptor M2-like [Mercenaria mercenaria]XP_053396545.1 muscarinic acetylcholine receptor M2-like [Mercenaria mercenaria]XP_053396547.1 muscarinic acetylcholine receptor M2-like [Mercenaria mercenaria]XP_053396557.1 muscarinic acetylcholine receptor M2-like [Mercenaria mercenaria]XP_053396559.1 muscarinic ace
MEPTYSYKDLKLESHDYIHLNITNITQTDDNDLLMNYNIREFQSKLPAIIYTSILMLIGTPGNIIVLYVYFFKWRKSTSRMFILFLTALDLINCVTTLPMEIYIMIYSVILDKPWLCKVTRFSTYTLNSSSAAILVAIAIDRFRRICRPHGPQFSASKSKRICIGCIMLAFTLTWPALLFYGTRIIPLGQVHGKACLLENKYDTSIYPTIFFVFQMASTVVIFTTLSVLYYFVGIQVCKHRQMRMRRKAETAAAKDMIENEKTSTSKEDTLLQESDSTDLKITQIRRKSIKENKLDGIELKPLEINHLHVSSSFNDVSAADTVSTCDGRSRCDTIRSRCDTIISLPDEHRNGGSSKKRPRTSKHKFTKRKGTLKDSLTKVNGHCMHMKLRIGRSTLMLFLITCAYIVSFLPFYIIAIIRQTYSDFLSQLEGTSYMTYNVFLRSYLLSSAINPIIYSFCNAQFRSFCLDMCRKKTERRTIL